MGAEVAEMVTLRNRVADFSSESPVVGRSHQLLCRDNRGTYVLPYPCIWSGQQWLNAEKSLLIEAEVVGWRLCKEPATFC